MSKKFSVLARLKSFKFALKGLWHVVQHEHNFRVHLFATLLVLLLGFYLNLSVFEWLWIVAAIAMVLVAELFNSSIEKLVDLVSPDFNPKAAIIKDIAAAAVLITAITAVVIGTIIFYPYFFNS
ncbi:diacylglycerol kinase family protein [Roseivirga echinicomitans]|uniref:Diacylglycerol kinase n=1 Tax=Roseivirga echinicomitans TaxID=296218 RepID=A0A150XVH1_9BACT|nr:diacylglycerol kinase family protein [Roseivirga echinicomitans]KYG82696.1 diacylglycerol kinase [Roseivirga echinicomitans]